MVRPNNIIFVLGLLLIVAGGLFLRVENLSDRPMHTDEAVHAYKLGHLLEDGDYRFDPTEFHGPTLYYLSLPLLWLDGDQIYSDIDEVSLRSFAVIFGIALIILSLILRSLMDRWGILLVMLFTAVSPILVYYSRYYIHEMMLTFYMLGFLGACWHYIRTHNRLWALMIGVFAGLIHATKETCVLMFFAFIVAGLAACSMEYFNKKNPSDRTVYGWIFHHLKPIDVAISLGVALIVSLIFYSSFGSNMSGMWDAFSTYLNYIDRAGGQGHEKPWYYYFQILFWYKEDYGYVGHELPVMISTLLGSVLIFLIKHEAQDVRIYWRTLALYPWVLMGIYMCIPYKMPWLAIAFVHGFILPAAFLLRYLIKISPHIALKSLLALAFVFMFYKMIEKARLGSGRFGADIRNPYVYSHTGRDFLKFSPRVNQIAALHPDKKDILVKVISDEYWPIPWYLRDFPNVGYWKNEIPENPDAPIIVTSLEMYDQLDKQLKDDYEDTWFGLRYGVILVLKVRKDLWEKFMETQI